MRGGSLNSVTVALRASVQSGTNDQPVHFPALLKASGCGTEAIYNLDVKYVDELHDKSQQLFKLVNAF